MQIVNKIIVHLELREMIKRGLVIQIDNGCKITKKGLAYKEFMESPCIDEENKTYEYFIKNYYKECIMF